jgi:uncharacterized protein with HEPN domain
MSERKFIHFLNDILTSSEKVIILTKDKSYEEFIKDWVVIDATIRNLEIIGEAVKKLPTNLKKRYSHIEWRKIAGLRDILIHEYFGINYKILWDIVKNKIPNLKEQIEKIIKEY